MGFDLATAILSKSTGGIPMTLRDEVAAGWRRDLSMRGILLCVIGLRLTSRDWPAPGAPAAG